MHGLTRLRLLLQAEPPLEQGRGSGLRLHRLLGQELHPKERGEGVRSGGLRRSDQACGIIGAMTRYDATETAQDNTAALVSEEEQVEDGVDVEREDESLPIEHPFNPEKISIATKSPTIDLIVSRIKENEIDLEPDFQREQMWNHLRKSRLIESLLLRVPIPAFYVAADDEDHWKVVDGIQRLSSINSYINNDFLLKKLEYLSDFEGKRYEDLPRAMQRRIKETELVVNVISPSTPVEVMFNIFLRINTGGVPLNPQEIRNALTPPYVRDYLKTLAQSYEFLRATENSIRPNRMADRECILRFLAFYIDHWSCYSTSTIDLNTYLTNAMRKISETRREERNRLAGDFKKAMDAGFRIFGRDTFRRQISGNWRSAVNKALLETWSVALANCSREEIDILVSKRDAIKKESVRLMSEDGDFLAAISYSTGNQKRVEKRFSAVEHLVRSML